MKYILGIIAVLLLAHFFVPRMQGDNMIFDPMDTDDSAVFSQRALNSMIDPGDHNYYKPDSKFSSEQQTGKKYKTGKHNFEIICLSHVNNFPFLSLRANLLIPRLLNQYRFLFFKEINPPPPKSQSLYFAPSSPTLA